MSIIVERDQRTSSSWTVRFLQQRRRRDYFLHSSCSFPPLPNFFHRLLQLYRDATPMVSLVRASTYEQWTRRVSKRVRGVVKNLTELFQYFPSRVLFVEDRGRRKQRDEDKTPLPPLLAPFLPHQGGPRTFRTAPAPTVSVRNSLYRVSEGFPATSPHPPDLYDVCANYGSSAAALYG